MMSLVTMLAGVLALIRHVQAFTSLSSCSLTRPTIQKRPASTMHMVWWFGGTPGTSSETSSSGEECELVAVRIDRTSPNSRRISGDIVVNAPLGDVWAILTDYDNLATHVPNLVASRQVKNFVNSNSINGSYGRAGDGSYKCRLYQRGAQKIIGFEFGADVTMDMTESISQTFFTDASSSTSLSSENIFTEVRNIGFKCVDSQFFSEFDGTWRVVQMPNNPLTGDAETTVSYTVHVRPKGPVPVAALEWRIREDVPTNLRAVKRAAMQVGLVGVMGDKVGNRKRLMSKDRVNDMFPNSGFADFILDYENETLGAYLK